MINLHGSKGNTIKRGAPEHGSMEHGTQAQQLNTGTLTEYWNTSGGTLGHSRSNWNTTKERTRRTRADQCNNRTMKQHQEILQIQNDDRLSRQHNRVQNKKIILARKIFMEKLKADSGDSSHVINLREKIKSRTFTQVPMREYTYRLMYLCRRKVFS